MGDPAGPPTPPPVPPMPPSPAGGAPSPGGGPQWQGPAPGAPRWGEQPPAGDGSPVKETAAEAWAAVGLPPETGRFRQRPPRRISARTVLGGLGLLGILLTVAIMGLLGSRILSSVNGDGEDASLEEHVGLVDEQPADAPGEDGTAGSPGISAPVDRADASRCEIDRNTVLTAARAYEAMHGTPPPDQLALVDEDLLTAEAATVDYRVVDGEPTVSGRGDCTES